MLSKLLKIIDFKQSILEEDDETIKVNCKEEIIKEVDTIINSSFLRTIHYIQKHYKEVYEITKTNIEKDLEEICVFECEEYKEEVVSYIKQEFRNLHESIIEVLPEIEQEETK